MKNRKIIVYMMLINLFILITGCVFLKYELNKKDNEIKYTKIYATNKIETLEGYISAVIKKNEELLNTNYKLEKNIYNIFEKKPYNVTIHHDGDIITYKQNKFGLFGDYSKEVTHIGFNEESE